MPTKVLLLHTDDLSDPALYARVAAFLGVAEFPPDFQPSRRVPQNGGRSARKNAQAGKGCGPAFNCTWLAEQTFCHEENWPAARALMAHYAASFAGAADAAAGDPRFVLHLHPRC